MSQTPIAQPIASPSAFPSDSVISASRRAFCVAALLSEAAFDVALFPSPKDAEMNLLGSTVSARQSLLDMATSCAGMQQASILSEMADAWLIACDVAPEEVPPAVSFHGWLVERATERIALFPTLRKLIDESRVDAANAKADPEELAAIDAFESAFNTHLQAFLATTKTPNGSGDSLSWAQNVIEQQTLFDTQLLSLLVSAEDGRVIA